MQNSKSVFWVTWFLCLGLVVIGCGSDQSSETTYREGESPVTQVSEGDPEMTAAIAEAKATLADFIAVAKNPGKRELSFKVAFKDGRGSSEHIWVEFSSFKNGIFQGRLGNTPLNLPDKKLGDPVEARQEDIEDWIIMDGEDMKGGYTAKLLMAREAAK